MTNLISSIATRQKDWLSDIGRRSSAAKRRLVLVRWPVLRILLGRGQKLHAVPRMRRWIVERQQQPTEHDPVGLPLPHWNNLQSGKSITFPGPRIHIFMFLSLPVSYRFEKVTYACSPPDSSFKCADAPNYYYLNQNLVPHSIWTADRDLNLLATVERRVKMEIT